jgi:hypothetical protein
VFDGDNRKIDPTNGAGSNLDNAVDLGNGSHRFKDLYLSGGVYLGGTGAANKLDDYEEGTWTPTLTGSSGAPSSVTYSIRDAVYTKVGRLVQVSCRVVTTSYSGGSGEWTISGLPFTRTANITSNGAINHNNQVTYTGDGISPFVTSTNVVRARVFGSGRNDALQLSSINNAATAECDFNLTYITDA